MLLLQMLQEWVQVCPKTTDLAWAFVITITMFEPSKQSYSCSMFDLRFSLLKLLVEMMCTGTEIENVLLSIENTLE